jgi:integrase/recombinase XerD
METTTELPVLIAGVSRLLKRKKYRPTTLESYHLTWRRIKNYMTAQNITAFTKEVGEAFIKDWFGDRPYDDLNMHEKNYIYYTMVLWYYQLNHTLPPNIKKKPDFVFSGKLGALFNEFLAYKAETCAPSTLRLYRYRLYPLYYDLLRSKQEIATIDGPYLVRYLSRLDMTQKIKEKNRMIEQTGMFLTFLCSKNMLANNKPLYWTSILKPRTIKQPKMPSVYSREEVERLINAIDRSNAPGKRDFAIVLLAARYGLRGSDIMGLRHCNLDWANNRITIVQRKTTKKVELPLSEEVGNAIIDYLKFGRPDVNEPYIFLAARPPFGKLITIHKVITKHMRKADIAYEERKHGPHALRHSLASNLLGLHEPMPVISSILGHSTTASTTPYLRVDFDQLKQCALEVPCVPSSFYTNLYEQAI